MYRTTLLHRLSLVTQGHSSRVLNCHHEDLDQELMDEVTTLKNKKHTAIAGESLPSNQNKSVYLSVIGPMFTVA